MKVAIVHDDLVQCGGAERVLEAMCEVFPQAPIFTSVYDKDNHVLATRFAGKKIITSFMQNLPFWKDFYRPLLPLYPVAFEQFDFSEFDLVISQTTRFAKAIITKPQTKHICYCHTPPRFLWAFSGEKENKLLGPILENLRRYDFISSKRVDFWFAGSKNAEKRIEKIYKQKSQVLYPFVDLQKYRSAGVFDGGYFLVVSRLNKYKRVDLALKVFAGRKTKLNIVGVGPQFFNLLNQSSPNVEFFGGVGDGLLVNLLSGCKGLIVTAEEDFGLTSLEAQALGKPVIAFGRGGALETVIEGKTGVFFTSQDEYELEKAVDRFESMTFAADDCIANASRFGKEIFKKRLKKLVSNVV